MTTNKRSSNATRASASRTDSPVGTHEFEEIVNNLPIALVVWRLDDPSDPRSLRLAAINKQASSVMHTTAEEAFGKPIGELLPGIFETNVPQIYVNVALTGKPYDIEEIRYADAILEDAYYRVRVFPLAGRHVGVAFEDISGRKRAEETIRQIEEALSPATGENFFRALVEILTRTCQVEFAFIGRLHPGDARQIQTIAVSHRGQLVDNFTYDMEGTPCNLVVGERFCHFPSDVQSQFAQDAMLKELGIESYMGTPLFSSQGKPIGLIALLHGKAIAQPEQAKTILHVVAARGAAELERQVAEEALRSSEAFLRMSQQVGNVGSWQWDLRTNQVRWSECMFTLYGLKPDQFDGTLTSAIANTHPDDVAAVQECIRQLMEKSLGYPVEYRVIRSNGEIAHLWGHGEVIRDAAGNPALVVGTVVDITARKRAEEERHKLEVQIQQAQKMESLGILAGGIAHDFNNILTGVLGYADLAMQELSVHSSARALIGEAAKAARRAADLTKQLLAYSGKGRFVLNAIDLNALVKDMAPLLQISVNKKCALKFDLDPELPMIEADATQIQQVVMNLVINASEAIGGEVGVIALTTGVTYCDQTALEENFLHDNASEGSYVYLEVVDSGGGMSEETQKRIFEPFFTTKFTGRGLGLAAALGIIRGHRGLVKVHSQLGKGTTFKVAFPATNLDATANSDGPRAEADWQHSDLILVVDDEESIRELAKNMLERMGFTVITAADGREAVGIFAQRQNEIGLVILDMTMPRLDGEETFRELRHIRNDVKAILSSGYDEQSATSRFSGKGLTGFLQKPYTYEQLMTACRKALADD